MLLPVICLPGVGCCEDLEEGCACDAWSLRRLCEGGKLDAFTGSSQPHQALRCRPLIPAHDGRSSVTRTTHSLLMTGFAHIDLVSFWLQSVKIWVICVELPTVSKICSTRTAQLCRCNCCVAWFVGVLFWLLGNWAGSIGGSDWPPTSGRPPVSDRDPLWLRHTDRHRDGIPRE